MKNLKDTMTNIAGALGVIGSITLVVAKTVTLPSPVIAVAGTLVAISVAVIGYFTGKNSDGTSIPKV